MKQLRERSRFSYARLAREVTARGVKMHQPTVQRIEDGNRPVRLFEAEVIADTFNVPLSAMLRADGATESPLARAIADAAAQLADAQASVQGAEASMAQARERIAIVLKAQSALLALDGYQSNQDRALLADGLSICGYLVRFDRIAPVLRDAGLHDDVLSSARTSALDFLRHKFSDADADDRTNLFAGAFERSLRLAVLDGGKDA